jgi:hypothetical protein
MLCHNHQLFMHCTLLAWIRSIVSRQKFACPDNIDQLQCIRVYTKEPLVRLGGH